MNRQTKDDKSSTKAERKRAITATPGLNIRAPLRYEVLPARWSLWGQMRTAELWHAIALSMNKDPIPCEELPGQGLAQPEVAAAFGGDEFFRRLLIAHDALGGPLRSAIVADAEEAGRETIDLAVFAAWAESLVAPWNLPEEFPRPSLSMHGASQRASECTMERCARLLDWFREEQAIALRGALARVAARDGRKRQTVKADIDKALKASKEGGSIRAMVHRMGR